MAFGSGSKVMMPLKNEAGLPLDGFAIAQNKAEVLAYDASIRFIGMAVYCIDEKMKFRFKNGIDDSDFVPDNESSAVTWGNITGDINNQSDLMALIEVINNKFMDTITYANKKVTITYKNGLTTDIDLTSIITDTSIGEFKDVNLADLEDGQVIKYDISTSKWVNKTDDTLDKAREYTDNKIADTYRSPAEKVSVKPNPDDASTEIGVWYVYADENNDTWMTMFFDDETGAKTEINVLVGIKIENLVEKEDIASTYEENPADLTKIPDLNYIKGLVTIINTALGTKVNITDIVDDLVSDSVDKPLSANQGKVLKQAIDDTKAELEQTISNGLAEKLDIDQGVDNANKSVKTDENGKIVFVEGGASGSAEDIVYENENHTEWSNVKKALDGILEIVEYVNPEIKSFTKSVADVYEIGQSVASITFNWVLNKAVTTQTLTDVTLADESVRTGTYSTPLSANKTFILTVGDGKNTASKSLTVSFQNKVYWGSASTQETYDSAFILGLASNKFSTTKNGTYSMDVASGEYGFIAFPASFGTITQWNIGGFDTTVDDCGTVEFTNSSGYVSTYHVYKTGRSGLGSISPVIK